MVTQCSFWKATKSLVSRVPVIFLTIHEVSWNIVVILFSRVFSVVFSSDVSQRGQQRDDNQRLVGLHRADLEGRNQLQNVQGPHVGHLGRDCDARGQAFRLCFRRQAHQALLFRQLAHGPHFDGSVNQYDTSYSFCWSLSRPLRVLDSWTMDVKMVDGP